MRTLSALIITALVAVPAFAQPQRPGGGRGMFGGGGPLMLLNVEDVQKDLKITDEQKTKIKEYQDKQAAAMREARGDGGQPDLEKIREMMTKAREEGAKFLKEALTEEQTKRLNQISLQQSLKNNPAGAFFTVNFSRDGTTYGDPTETGRALKVTDEQKEKIKGIADQLSKDRRELTGGGGGGGRPMRLTADQQKKLDALTKEANEKIMEVFTEEQHKTLKELMGKPFEGKIEQPGGGRRPGGAGGAPRRDG